jgi:hypothetical protein
MYTNGKMRHVESIPGMRGGRIKENGRRGEFNMIYHNVSPIQQ